MNPYFHTAKEMLKAAEAHGYLIKVYSDGDLDFRGHDASRAWDAVAATDGAEITLHNPDDSLAGWAYLMADGPGTCDPQETIVDHSAEGFIADWWAANRAAILA